MYMYTLYIYIYIRVCMVEAGASKCDDRRVQCLGHCKLLTVTVAQWHLFCLAMSLLLKLGTCADLFAVAAG